MKTLRSVLFIFLVLFLAIVASGIIGRLAVEWGVVR